MLAQKSNLRPFTKVYPGSVSYNNIRLAMEVGLRKTSKNGEDGRYHTELMSPD